MDRHRRRGALIALGSLLVIGSTSVQWQTVLKAAQAGGSGTISGRVTVENGGAVTGVSVEAKEAATGTVYKAAVSRQGEYTFPTLPAGRYDVSVPMMRGAFTETEYRTFVQKGVVVPAGVIVPLNIEMKLQGNLATLGDAPVAMLNGMRARTTVSTAPTPRMPDGKPDFSGLWLTEGDSSEQPPPLRLQPWSEKIRKERQENRTTVQRSSCLPGSPIPIAAIRPHQIVQNASMLVVLEEEYAGWTQVFLDGRPHPPSNRWNPSYLGHAIGKWEGDTLVVDVVGFNDYAFWQGAPHTEQLHIVERFRRPDTGHLEIDITAEDPGAFIAVWKQRVTATLAGKDEQLLEFLCENHAPTK